MMSLEEYIRQELERGRYQFTFTVTNASKLAFKDDGDTNQMFQLIGNTFTLDPGPWNPPVVGDSI